MFLNLLFAVDTATVLSLVSVHPEPIMFMKLLRGRRLISEADEVGASTFAAAVRILKKTDTKKAGTIASPVHSS